MSQRQELFVSQADQVITNHPGDSVLFYADGEFFGNELVSSLEEVEKRGQRLFQIVGRTKAIHD